MAEEQQAPQEQPETPQPAPVETETVAVGSDATEVENGKTFAILSYALALLYIPFFIIPLITRDNEFSLYHAKQCLLLWLVAVAGNVILYVTCIGPVVVSIFVLVCLIMGLINAVNGIAKPVPLVGKWAEDWFKGLQKQ